jgi:hypothetical protein
MVKLAVEVVVGPKEPVAVLAALVCPPTEIVNEPAVLPVTVQLIWCLVALAMVALWVKVAVPPPPAWAKVSSGDSVQPAFTVQPAEVRSSEP